MQSEFCGRLWLLGNDIDTDIIMPTEYLALPSVADMAPYAFSPLRAGLAAQIKRGDIIVAGSNFGCGSSREQAPEVIKALGVACVIAKSYARIFYRNAVNNGLLLLENNKLCDDVTEGDELCVTIGKNILYKGKSYAVAPMAENVLEILKAGGLVEAMRKRNGLQ